MGSSLTGLFAATPKRLRIPSCSWACLRSELAPKPCLPPGGERRLSWDPGPYSTLLTERIRLTRGSQPRHLPSSGFDYPPDGFHSTRPGDGTSPPQHSWGSPFKALLLPTNWAPSRGLASLVVPPPGTRPNGRDFRGLYGWEGEREATTEAAARRTLPSWVFSPPGLSPPPTESGFPLLPLVPFRPEALPTVPLPGGASGVDIRRNWLASLEAAGPHGVLHLSDSCRLLRA